MLNKLKEATGRALSGVKCKSLGPVGDRLAEVKDPASKSGNRFAVGLQLTVNSEVDGEDVAFSSKIKWVCNLTKDRASGEIYYDRELKIEITADQASGACVYVATIASGPDAHFERTNTIEARNAYIMKRSDEGDNVDVTFHYTESTPATDSLMSVIRELFMKILRGVQNRAGEALPDLRGVIKTRCGVNKLPFMKDVDLVLERMRSRKQFRIVGKSPTIQENGSLTRRLVSPKKLAWLLENETPMTFNRPGVLRALQAMEEDGEDSLRGGGGKISRQKAFARRTSNTKPISIAASPFQATRRSGVTTSHQRPRSERL
jgi:hypothetical protein